jgi:hypothetical protein
MAMIGALIEAEDRSNVRALVNVLLKPKGG